MQWDAPICSHGSLTIVVKGMFVGGWPDMSFALYESLAASGNHTLLGEGL